MSHLESGHMVTQEPALYYVYMSYVRHESTIALMAILPSPELVRKVKSEL